MTKLALLGHFAPAQIVRITKRLDAEIVPAIYSSGDDATLALSHPSGSTRYYAWSRRFGRGKTWTIWEEGLDGLLDGIERLTANKEKENGQ